VITRPVSRVPDESLGGGYDGDIDGTAAPHLEVHQLERPAPRSVHREDDVTVVDAVAAEGVDDEALGRDLGDVDGRPTGPGETDARRRSDARRRQHDRVGRVDLDPAVLRIDHHPERAVIHVHETLDLGATGQGGPQDQPECDVDPARHPATVSPPRRPACPHLLQRRVTRNASRKNEQTRPLHHLACCSA